jgi:1,4-alpha-glucan branching enzyme
MKLKPQQTMFLENYTIGSKNDRYSAKKVIRPTNFSFFAPSANNVSVIGEFNNWQPNANPMHRRPDGSWITQIPLHHGHHRYMLLVDGKTILDPRAQGITRNERNERVSLIAIS